MYLITVPYVLALFLAWTLIPSNVAGRTKKTIISSCTFLGYCVGNMAGSQIFKNADAPRYGKFSPFPFARTLPLTTMFSSQSPEPLEPPSRSACNSSLSSAGGSTTCGRTVVGTRRPLRVGSVRRSRRGLAESLVRLTRRIYRTRILGTLCESGTGVWVGGRLAQWGRFWERIFVSCWNGNEVR